MTWWRCFTSHEVIESRDSWRTDGHWSGRCPAIGPGTHDAGCGWIDLGRGGPVDGRNPANQLRLVVHPIIYKISQWIVYPSWGLSIVCLSFVSPSILKVFRHLAKMARFLNHETDDFPWNSHEIRGMLCPVLRLGAVPLRELAGWQCLKTWNPPEFWKWLVFLGTVSICLLFAAKFETFLQDFRQKAWKMDVHFFL